MFIYTMENKTTGCLNKIVIIHIYLLIKNHNFIEVTQWKENIKLPKKKSNESGWEYGFCILFKVI